MTRLITAMVMGVFALPVWAEDHIANFQLRMIDRASQANNAGAAVACGGMYRALSLISDEGSDNAAAFADHEADVAFVGIIFLENETGVDSPTAIAAIAEHISAVSTIYLDWFTDNLANDGTPLNDQVRDNYSYCEDKRAEWQAAINGG